jgi:putative ATPase
MSDLFTREPESPLAELLRPTSLEEVVGQSHLLGKGKPLRVALEAKKLRSFILWGPPGVGKTTLARLAARLTNSEFTPISAVSDGVKDLRAAVERAQNVLDRSGRKTVMFVDEIHRFNKAQQDALLPHVESGLVCLIGATSENATMAVNSALLSRAQVYRLLPLTEEDLTKLYARARSRLDNLEIEPDALKLLVGWADGDARKMLNLLEGVHIAAAAAGRAKVDAQFVQESAAETSRRSDTEVFYELISALQKSIRGSSPNAALYWLARLLDAGIEGKVIARRLIVMASEEVGNADPRALQVATSAADGFEKVGSPEGDLALAHAAVYIAMAPKSNAVYSAWGQARAFVANDHTRAVPMHLRNAPTELMKQMGFKEGYRYAHDEPDAYAAGEHYFPDDMDDPQWYQPNPRGLEVTLAERLGRWQERDEAARSTGKGRKRR